MKVNRNIRRFAKLARDTLSPPQIAHDPVEEAAQRAALAPWQNIYQQFGPQLEDADILVVGCGDGRLAARFVTHGAARSVTGVEAGATVFAPTDNLEGKLRLAGDLALLDTLGDSGFDIILAPALDAQLPLEHLERRTRRLYDLLRPGGEAIVNLGCAPARPQAGTGAGYGFMTPSSWAGLFMRAGFEIANVTRVWRDDAEGALLRERLPQTRDEERLCDELRLHLYRPWETWELAAAERKPARRRRR